MASKTGVGRRSILENLNPPLIQAHIPSVSPTAATRRFLSERRFLTLAPTPVSVFGSMAVRAASMCRFGDCWMEPIRWLFPLSTLTANSWQQNHHSAGLPGCGASPNFNGIWIQGTTGSAQPTFYVDDVELVTAPRAGRCSPGCQCGAGVADGGCAPIWTQYRDLGRHSSGNAQTLPAASRKAVA